MFPRHKMRLMVGLGCIACAATISGRVEAFGPCGDLTCVNLEWRPAEMTVSVGDRVHIGLYAVSTETDLGQWVASLTAILNWDPSVLRLIDRFNNGPYDWLASVFPDELTGLDPDGLNLTFLDGDAFYVALGQVAPQPLPFVEPDGLLVTTMLFEALAETPETSVSFVRSFGESETVVFDGLTPGVDVTGTLGQATIRIVPEPGTLVLLLMGGLAVRARRFSR